MKRLTLVIMTIIVLVSCKKERIDYKTGQEYQYNNYVLAGDTVKSRIQYYVIKPNIYLPEIFGSYTSIDLNKDSVNDITLGINGEGIETPICPCDSGVICDCFPNPHIEKYIQTLDSIEIAVGKNSNYVKKFMSGDTINQIQSWKNLKYPGVLVYRSPNNNYGEWTDTLDNYVGFRIRNSKDTIYGWLRINLKSGLQVFDYATNRIKK